MTKENAIKYLQQVYPEGGHCWLDKQRIEAISMAIEALREEPVSEDLEEAINQSFIYHENRGDDFRSDEQIETSYRYGFETGAKWQKEQDQSTIELAEDHAMLAGMEKMKEQMMKDVIDAHCFGFQGAALFSFRLPAGNYLVGSEVKVIVIKEDEL
jgi:hypothetical protein